ncbi:transposase-like zinc-binding domain-containing protein [Trueperella pyogenes]|uniref:transposase-like zinc-binding domain-containing protein n=1 Tax=Trueperella pyogenes TaxID=1661 RepID=UPI003C7A2647
MGKLLSTHARQCSICSQPCKKKGTTKAGAQRWYCKECRYSFTSINTHQIRAR